ncbi:MAG: DUF3817 domain-containing protein [Streptosporangiales bacterium]|nr:DUF3817 domain-containing protein [Streptosporangiales bacterium]
MSSQAREGDRVDADTQASTDGRRKSVRGALVRYRVMAYVTGVLLITLVFVAMPLDRIWHIPEPVAVIGQVHGYLYMVYLVAAADLARRVRLSFTRMVAMFLAGVVPTVAFFCERRVTRWVKESRYWRT